MKVGLALGSGGARGWCHIGVLRELERQGVQADAVAGCSMGALVGAAWAGGCLDALEDWARGLTQARFLRYMDLRFDSGGLVGGAAVEDILNQIGLPDVIEKLEKPFLAVATDMGSGREVWMADGPLLPAVRASISIPGVFSPVERNGRWLLDGGLINPVPGSAVRALGADVILAVNPNAKHRALWTPEAEPEPGMLERIGAGGLEAHLPAALVDLFKDDAPKGPSYMDVVSVSIDILSEFLRKSRAASDPPHVMLEADLSDISVLELFRAEEAIEEGRRIARAAEREIAAALGG